jgi:hypothetical protein
MYVCASARATEQLYSFIAHETIRHISGRKNAIQFSTYVVSNSHGSECEYYSLLGYITE